MATVKIKVRALSEGGLAVDQVILKNGYRDDRFMFYVSPKGTADGDVKETEIVAEQEAAFKAAIIQREGLTILNNPDYDDVKTDTDGDGANDTGKYNWSNYGQLYEIV